jgi:uncharacterized protein
MNYWLIFTTGFLSGGFSCIAIQGGLLAATIASQTNSTNNLYPEHTCLRRQVKGFSFQYIKSILLPTALFLISKIIAYTFLGFFLGLFGSFFHFSITTSIMMQFLVGILMIFQALQMFDVHPFFRKFTLTPSKNIFKFLRQNTKSTNMFTPLLLGIFTIFLPCGTTQAMEIAAIGTQNPITGALTMLTYSLGTTPFFFILGTLMTKFQFTFKKYVYPATATLILFLGILALDNCLTLMGSQFTLKSFWNTATGANQNTSQNAVLNQNIQTSQINVTNQGYSPNKINLKANIPTTISFITKNIYSCSRSIVFPSLKINKNLPETGITEILLPPLPKGQIAFSCSMGMYNGIININ